MWWFGIGLAVAAVLGVRRLTRSDVPPWLRHAISLGFPQCKSTHLSAERYGKWITHIGYLPDRAAGIGREDQTKLRISILVDNRAGFEIVAQTGTAADGQPGQIVVGPWVVSRAAPQKRARAFLDAIEPTARRLGRARSLALESTFGGGRIDIEACVITSAAIDRDGLRAAVEATEEPR